MRWIVGALAALALGACTHAREGCEVCPPLVAIPGGSFLMGAAPGETGGASDEVPQHTVAIAPFMAGKFEVTFAEWDACVADGGCRAVADDSGWGRGKRPVTGVSWDAAQTYVAWLSTKTGQHWRLLTEAEWEYVARPGAPASGPAITGAQANFHTEDAAAHLKTMPVGSYPPNAWGLYDLHGNVSEWVEDCYTPGYSGAPADGSARTTGRCTSRVLRGGSWVHPAPALRMANRMYEPAWTPVNTIGFRVARSLPH